MTYHQNQIFECWKCGKQYRYGASTSTAPLCFCTSECHTQYTDKTGRHLPPAGALIPLDQDQTIPLVDHTPAI